MYSILIKKSAKAYEYALNDDGTVYAGNSETTQAKVLELLGTYPRGSVVVVHNVTLSLSLELSDVTE